MLVKQHRTAVVAAGTDVDAMVEVFVRSDHRAGRIEVVPC